MCHMRCALRKCEWRTACLAFPSIPQLLHLVSGSELHRIISSSIMPPKIEYEWREVWRELRSWGWKSKKPSLRSNSSLYTYFDGNAPVNERVRGENLFVGEDEVMAFCKEKRILHKRWRSKHYTAAQSGSSATQSGSSATHGAIASADAASSVQEQVATTTQVQDAVATTAEDQEPVDATAQVQDAVATTAEDQEPVAATAQVPDPVATATAVHEPVAAIPGDQEVVASATASQEAVAGIPRATRRASRHKQKRKAASSASEDASDASDAPSVRPRAQGAGKRKNPRRKLHDSDYEDVSDGSEVSNISQRLPTLPQSVVTSLPRAVSRPPVTNAPRALVMSVPPATASLTGTSVHPATALPAFTPPVASKKKEKRKKKMRHAPLDAADVNYGDMDSGIRSDMEDSDCDADASQATDRLDALDLLEDEMREPFLAEDVSSTAGQHADLNDNRLDQMARDGWNDVLVDAEGDQEELGGEDNVYDGPHGPSASANRAAGDGPLALFFYFVPKSFWIECAYQTTLYESSTRKQRIARRKQDIKVKYKSPAER